MSVIHFPIAFSVPSDPNDLDLVTPADWAADHEHPPFLIYAITRLNSPGWAVPLARTELLNKTSFRTVLNMQYTSQLRMIATVMKPKGKGTLIAQWSDNNGASWNSFDGLGGPTIALARYGVLDSGFVNLSQTTRNAAQFVRLLIRIAGEGGDGVFATNFGHIALYVL